MEEKIVFAEYGHFLWKSLNLRVYMFSNSNPDFPVFFNAVASKLNSYNGIDDTFDDNYIQRYATYSRWPNPQSRQYLSLLIDKYKKDTGNNFCGKIMSPTYLLNSADDPKRKKMCIFITGTNPHNPQDKVHRLHSAATVYFKDKTISSDSESSSASSNSMTLIRQKVLNVEAICAAPGSYVLNNGGRRMMALLVGACREMSIKNIYLNAINVTKTLEFYQRLGLTKTGETDDEGNIEFRHESGMSNSNITFPNTVFATAMGTGLVNRRKKHWSEQNLDAQHDLDVAAKEPEVGSKRGREGDAQHDLEVATATATAAVGNKIPSEGDAQHDLEATEPVRAGKKGRYGGSNKRKRKSKKRKSKAQNSKTRARVF